VKASFRQLSACTCGSFRSLEEASRGNCASVNSFRVICVKRVPPGSADIIPVIREGIPAERLVVVDA
jgi:hypothetical protein